MFNLGQNTGAKVTLFYGVDVDQLIVAVSI